MRDNRQDRGPIFCHRKCNIRHFLASSIFSVLVMFAGLTKSSYALELEKGGVYTEDEKNPSFYLKSGSMDCDKLHIVVVASCYQSEKYNRTPFCPIELLSFFKVNKYESKNIIYNHLFSKSSSEFLYKVDCLYSGIRTYFVAKSTNFSVCDKCEWVDIYDTDVTYLGSSGLGSRDRPFGFKPMPNDIARDIYSKDSKTMSSVLIDRTP